MCPTSGVMSTETPPSVARRKKEHCAPLRDETHHIKPKVLGITQGFIEKKAKEVADSVKRNAAQGFVSSETSGRLVELAPGNRRVVDPGKFNPAQPQQGFVEPQKKSITRDQLEIPAGGNEVPLGRITPYNVADKLSGVPLQGTGYVNGKWYAWNGRKVVPTDGVHGAYKNGFLVSMREWSTEMKGVYAQGVSMEALAQVEPMSVAGGKDKAKHYQVVVTDAGYIFQRVDDTGGAFKSGTSKRDWYMGMKTQAEYDYAEVVELGVLKVSKGVFVTNGKTYEFEPKDLQGALDFIMELEKQGMHAVTLT